VRYTPAELEYARQAAADLNIGVTNIYFFGDQLVAGRPSANGEVQILAHYNKGLAPQGEWVLLDNQVPPADENSQGGVQIAVAPTGSPEQQGETPEPVGAPAAPGEAPGEAATQPAAGGEQEEVE